MAWFWHSEKLNRYLLVIIELEYLLWARLYAHILHTTLPTPSWITYYYLHFTEAEAEVLSGYCNLPKDMGGITDWDPVLVDSGEPVCSQYAHCCSSLCLGKLPSTTCVRAAQQRCTWQHRCEKAWKFHVRETRKVFVLEIPDVKPGPVTQTLRASPVKWRW